jgi:hypothetical protein
MHHALLSGVRTVLVMEDMVPMRSQPQPARWRSRICRPASSRASCAASPTGAGWASTGIAAGSSAAPSGASTRTNFWTRPATRRYPCARQCRRPPREPGNHRQADPRRAEPDPAGAVDLRPATCGWRSATSATRRCSACPTGWSDPAPVSRTRSATWSCAANTGRNPTPRRRCAPASRPHSPSSRITWSASAPMAAGSASRGRRCRRAAGSRSIPTSPRSSCRSSFCAPAPRSCRASFSPMPSG